MGIRFRKIIQLLPGVKINIGKGGVSASVGSRGLSVNLSRSGLKGTVGVPGTGLSYSQQIEINRKRPVRTFLIVIAIVAISCWAVLAMYQF